MVHGFWSRVILVSVVVMITEVYAAKQPAPEEAALVQSESETADMLGLSFVQLRSSDPAQKKTAKGLGIVAMLVQLRDDIGGEQAEKTRDEQEQQKDYEQFMKDASVLCQSKTVTRGEESA